MHASGYLLLLCSVNSTPTKKKLLIHVVGRVAPQWYDLGITLLKEEQEAHLDVIKANYTDKKTCCKEMLWYWLNTNVNATWKQLIEALQSPAVELPVVAADIVKMLTGTAIVKLL